MNHITVLQASRQIGTTTDYVYRLVRSGTLPTVDTDPIRLDRDDLLAYLKTRVPETTELRWKDPDDG